eukprot:284405_1
MASESSPSKMKSEIIYESILLKRGKYQNTFKEKWFVLLSNYVLVYYSSESASKLDISTCAGRILLKDVNNFRIIYTDKKTLSSLNNNGCGVQIKSSYLEIIKSPSSDHEYNEDNEYIMELDTIDRTYTFCSSNMFEFKQWIFYLENMIFGGIIYSGYLMKQGGKWKSWKKRWFILNNNQNILLLKYYQSNKLKIFKGSIDLLLVTSLCRGDEQTNGKKYTIELHTPSTNRVWILAADTEIHRNMWIQKLTKVMQSINNNKKNNNNNNKLSANLSIKHVKFSVSGTKSYNKDNADSEDSIHSVTSQPSQSQTRISITHDNNSSLDDYDGSIVIHNSIHSVNHSEVDSNILDENILPNEIGRFGSSAQISVHKWTMDKSISIDSDCDNYDGYKFNSLKTQFMDVHNIKLETSKTKTIMNKQQSADIESQDEKYNHHNNQIDNRFEERFNKILINNKINNININKQEKNMIKRW